MVEHFFPVAGADPLTRIDRTRSGGSSDAIVDLAAARQFLGRRWRMIAGVALLCVVASALVLSLIPKSYTATAILIVDPRTQKVTQSDAVLGGIGSDAAAVESQVEILESSTLAKRVVAELGLDRGGELTEPSAIEHATESLRGLFGLAHREPSAAEQRERVLQRFSERLRVRRRGLTYVLEIAYSSGSAETAAQVGNALADAYLADQKRQKLDAARSASGLLGARLDDLRGRARDTERAVSTFKNQNGIVDLGAAQTLLDREIAEQSQQLTQAQARGRRPARATHRHGAPWRPAPRAAARSPRRCNRASSRICASNTPSSVRSSRIFATIWGRATRPSARRRRRSAPSRARSGPRSAASRRGCATRPRRRPRASAPSRRASIASRGRPRGAPRRRCGWRSWSARPRPARPS
ncbi:GumC family protein [Methylobacterium gregans]|uniref:GumC family protein n=1 Tax=Methylobacterium gregans TaxID=374424 RepID=UPI00361538E3